MRYIFLLLLVLPTTTKAKDFYFNISTSLVYTNINDANYEFVNQYEQVKNPKNSLLSSLSVGISKEFKDNWTINFTTNRLHNKEVKRAVRNKVTGTILTNRTSLKTDTFQIGKRFKRFLPMLFVSNVEVDKSLWSGNSFLGRDVKHAFLGGLNLNYYVTKNISSSLFCLLPNQEINLEFGCGVGINYNF